ncbi:MAG: hypothetical protein JWQ43_237 [Glaciihabitans sp.]|nr:hypothetical protein [Glaciihabitans sp.]
MAAHDVTPAEHVAPMSKRAKKTIAAVGTTLAALLAIFGVWDRLFPADLSDAARIESVAITKHTTLSDYELSNPEDGLSVEPISESAPAFLDDPGPRAGTVLVKIGSAPSTAMEAPGATPTGESTSDPTRDDKPENYETPRDKPSGDDKGGDDSEGPAPESTGSSTLDGPEAVVPTPSVLQPEPPAPAVVEPQIPAEVPVQVPPQIPEDMSVEPPATIDKGVPPEVPEIHTPGDISVDPPKSDPVRDVNVAPPQVPSPADPVPDTAIVPAPAAVTEDYTNQLEVEPALRKYTTKTVHNAIKLLPPQSAPGGELPSLQDSAEQLASLLDEVETEAKPGGLEVQGWTVAVGLSIEGFNGEPLTLTWSLDGIDEDRSWPETGPNAYQVVASTANDTGTVDIWVPNLQATGDYNLNVRLLRNSNGHIVASSQPLLFAGDK